jgi:hypothetical protein
MFYGNYPVMVVPLKIDWVPMQKTQQITGIDPEMVE